MCFRLNQVYMCLSQTYLSIHLAELSYIPGAFRCLPDGFSYLLSAKFTTRSHPGKVWKIPRWVKQSPLGYWDRVFKSCLEWYLWQCSLICTVWTELSDDYRLKYRLNSVVAFSNAWIEFSDRLCLAWIFW